MGSSVGLLVWFFGPDTVGMHVDVPVFWVMACMGNQAAGYRNPKSLFFLYPSRHSLHSLFSLHKKSRINSYTIHIDFSLTSVI